MEFNKTELDGVYLIKFADFNDKRGKFVKTFNRSLYQNNGFVLDFPETFYSISRKNVIRGMHFQIPPVDHVKFVYCLKGSILDVLLDLREGNQYGKVVSFDLDDNVPQGILIPKGVAHGFLSKTDESIVVYHVTTEYSQAHDTGINPLTFGFNWPANSPIVSDRDLGHISLKDFKTPFKAKL